MILSQIGHLKLRENYENFGITKQVQQYRSWLNLPALMPINLSIKFAATATRYYDQLNVRGALIFLSAICLHQNDLD
jgi:hypothetical protein